ncbi:FAD-dependent oxidoreductase [Methylobacterium nonmethylotrophicum]|uniref:FAD-dependent monooxygenase n=1 Tax=Methylobacterium nonmethylotrophicum TaxID=1141884 RepID=A0A4Z0NJ26_9HYPH|nr:NAD(P)/FAD-dependent oxidoreductase [Methylobacterium nonmethylotrophicum]TGD96334.1 FAD-dependent monooxygenase [Methylobacterium nonmethylotrophicum]
MRRARIVIAGAGVAGAVTAHGLARMPAEVICLERSPAGDQDEAGTGLNIGPNAMTALRLHLPDLAGTLAAAGLPWRRWTADLTDGTRLLDLDVAALARGPGLRIRWAELYRILRRGLPVRYGCEATDLLRQPDGRASVRVATPAGPETIPDVDLVVAADGRYSRLRRLIAGPSQPRHLGIVMYRALWEAGPACPIDDYGQWFNGPNRLLAFRVPGDLVYCAGTFPLDPPDAPVPAAMKDAEILRGLYRPASGPPSRAAGYLIEGIARHVGSIHWARVQEDAILYAPAGWPVVLVGDAAHPMIPTLGQGATQSIEDGCSTADAIRAALANGAIAAVPGAVEARRGSRARFALDLSRAASDTLLAGADPVAGTREKAGPAFRSALERLYRDVDPPLAPAR